jgi:hypothetical protein
MGVIRSFNCLDVKCRLGHDHKKVRGARLRRGEGPEKRRGKENGHTGQEQERSRGREKDGNKRNARRRNSA